MSITQAPPHELPEYLESLNEQQRSAVLHHGRALLILAGAGSGKTRVITVKIAYLVDRLGVDPSSILAVTFTNKAAREMRDRAAELSPAAAEVFIRTFHSFGAWLVRRNAALLGLPAGFTIYDDDDQVSLLRTLYPERQRGVLARWARVISRAKDYGLRAHDDLSQVSGDPEFREIYGAYEKRLREIGNLDFGDLILYPIELLRDHPEVRRRIQARFRVILVDEYQDSNVAQYELLRRLADEQTYLCVVGDDDQSIYRFRGAEVRNIVTFPDRFPGTEVVRLEQNYRSTQPILSLAGAVVGNNSDRLGKTLWTDREAGPTPVLAALGDQDAEVEFCVRLLQDGVSAGATSAGSPVAGSPVAGGRITAAGTAILYRTNAQSRLFETGFLRAGIPYRVVGSVRFYEREEIKDAVAFLKFLANPHDEVAFRRIVNKPSRGIGPAKLSQIAEIATGRGIAFDEALAVAAKAQRGKARASLEGFLGILSEVRRSFGAGRLSELVERILERSGLARYHAEQDEIAGSQKQENLEELHNAASLYAGTEEGLLEFLEMLELDAERQAELEDPGAEAVTLITMHNTKGLEFDRVIVTGLEDGLFPREQDDPTELEEERRLFYVALTRARTELYLTTCRYRRVHGRTVECSPSRFLQEVPETLLRVEGGAEYGGYGGYGGRRGEDKELEYPAGSAVYHDEYGAGVVYKAWRDGHNEVVMVRFETGQTARFLPRYSALERIGDEV